MARSPTETIRFLTLDEFARLLVVMRGHPRDRALFLIAYRHGLHASEVGLLRIEDLGVTPVLCRDPIPSRIQFLTAARPFLSFRTKQMSAGVHRPAHAKRRTRRTSRSAFLK